MKAHLYKMTCLTNLHVGNGDVNYNIIDQEVEKDPINGLPMINSSGVKGALREFFEAKWGKNEKILKYFGSGKENYGQGSYKFLQMDMLFRPLRVSDNSNKSFALSTTKEIVDGFAERVSGLGGNLDGMKSFSQSNEKVCIEGGSPITLYNANVKWGKMVNKPVAVLENLKNYDLPVIARNCLDDNGISNNLWYEEYVPHESVFGLIILTPEDMDEDFKKALISEPVQFGGNASIGYGLMEIREV